MSNLDPPEASSPVSVSPPEKAANSNIKERLNLHVKRRLQESSDAEVHSGSHVNSASSHHHHHHTKRDKSGTTTPGGRGGKRSRGKTSSSVSSVPDDECSRDGNSSCNDGQKEKDNSPDILTMVLNEKKRSLLRDPEVVGFLDNVCRILGK